jgi:hypothetical protein
MQYVLNSLIDAFSTVSIKNANNERQAALADKLVK